VVVQGKLEPAPLGEWPALHSRVPSGALSVGGYHTAGAASRARLVEALRARIASLEAGPAGTLEALLLGSREEVDPGLYDGFRASGSLHLLALSGLHAGVLYLLGSLILWFVPRPRVRRLGACAFVVAYLILAGFRPSLFRAVVMIVTAAAAALLDRDSRPLNLLALAAVILLLVDPGSVLSLSFQLSFLALAGILVLGPGLERALERALPRMAAAPLAYSMAAQAATAPLLLHHFGSLRPVGILAALPLIPLVTLFIWSGVAYLALAATAAGGALAGFLASVHRVLEASVGLFARVPPVYGAAGVTVAAVLLAAGLLVCGLPVRGRRVPGLPAP
jgi:competence protein ComEC